MPSGFFFFVYVFSFFSSFTKALLHTEGRGSVLLGLQDVAQLLSLPLGTDACPHNFLDDLEGALVLGDLGQLHGWPLVGAKPCTSRSRPARTWCVGEVSAGAVPGLLTSSVSAWPLLRPRARG